MSPAGTVGELLTRAAATAPERPALVVGDRTLSYAELLDEAGALAGGLLAAGARPGDRVCLYAPNLAEAYVSLFGCALAGLVFVPVNPRLTPRELREVLDESGARFLLFVPEWAGFDYVSRLDVVEPGITRVTLRGSAPGALEYRRLLAGGRGAARPTVSPADPVLLQFTSGSTSTPKGALLAHAAVARMAHGLGERFGLTGDDRYFGCPPICHLGGTAFSLLTVLNRAATFVTLPVFTAAGALAAMARERCTVLHGIDSHLGLIIGEPGFDPPATLRLVSVSGVAETVREVAARFPGTAVISQYGSTEVGGAPVCAAADDPEEARLGTVGRPLAGVEVAVLDPDTGAPSRPGAVGEIRIGGWSLMLGYLRPEQTRAALDERGRMRTGDLGFVDPGGFLHFTGRLRNRLRTGGENVSVEEVESVLGRHPGITGAVVVGVPDERLGEVGHAFVQGADVDLDALRAHCRAELARFKIPRYFEVRDELPMTGTGKYARAELERAARAKVT
jgi:acyl-CoA synthetase (AMP-forming)/AMP-acid ligase II